MSWEVLLEIYTLEEILERSDVTQEEALEALYELGLIKLPEVTPVGLET